MTSLIQPLQSTAHPLANGMVHALGWTLLHFLWQGAIVAGVLWCVLALLGARSSEARYGATCCALLLIVAAPAMTFARLASEQYRLLHATTGSGTQIAPQMVLWVGAGGPTAPWPMRIVMALDHWVPWMLAAWFVGVTLYVVRLNLGLILAHRLKSRDTHAVATDLQRLFDDLRRRLGIDRAVRLVHSARVQVPTVIGWLRPVVLIPVSCLTGLSSDQIEAIFCHELAHVRRHDYLVSVFQSVVEALLFYHPAVWWVSKQVRRERECCCDALAVGAGGNVLAYARALSYLEERRATTPEFVLGANGGVLTMRIKRLLGNKDRAGGSPVAALLVLAAIFAIPALYFVATARAQANSRKATTPAAANEPMPQIASAAPDLKKRIQGQVAASTTMVDDAHGGMYTAWLNQDVVYIITPEERDAFVRLTNDEERDAFITNFWKRRDPPGAPANTFRQEHYARIAYANQHFATDTEPGWKTNRGRIYIVYGKPYAVDSHPSGGINADGTTSSPFEEWHYRLGGGKPDTYFRFTDAGSPGDYKLSVGPSPSAARSTPNVAEDSAGQQPPMIAVAAKPVGPMRVAAGVVAGNALHQVPPVYPHEAKEKRVQGVVVLHAIISKAGDVQNLQVISGHPLLTKSALDAVKQWKYKPYLLNGQPTEVETTINVNYTFAPEPSGPPSDESTAQPSTDQSIPISNSVRISSGIAEGMLISRVQPVYPPDVNAGSGPVVLKVIISKTGIVKDVQVISGPPGLLPASIDAVKQWKYTPYLLNGEPIDVQTTIMLNVDFGRQAQMPDPHIPREYAGEPLRKIGGDVKAPMVIYQVNPEFSDQAKKAKSPGGVILLNLIVDKQGLPQNVRVVRGIGMGLDEKALEAVRQYRFKPGMEGGMPVPVELNIEVNFARF